MLLETIDRTIFEKIRVAVVAAGYMPDQTAYGTIALYTAAKDALRTSLAATSGQLVEVFGVGSAEARDSLSVCKIVIDRPGYAKGGLGGFPAQFIEQTGTGAGATFKKYQMPSESKNLSYTIRCISNSAKMNRILLHIMDAVFGGRGYTKTVSNLGVFDGDTILIDLINMLDVTSTNVIENLYTFQVPDIWLTDPVQLGGTIVPMTTVTGEYYYNYTVDNTQIALPNQVIVPPTP